MTKNVKKSQQKCYAISIVTPNNTEDHMNQKVTKMYIWKLLRMQNMTKNVTKVKNGANGHKIWLTTKYTTNIIKWKKNQKILKLHKWQNYENFYKSHKNQKSITTLNRRKNCKKGQKITVQIVEGMTKNVTCQKSYRKKTIKQCQEAKIKSQKIG